MGRIFDGTNNDVDESFISPVESPVNSNCFFADGKSGVLGQRLGKTAHASYPADVWGYVPVLRPNGESRILVADENGDITDRPRTSQSNPYTIYPTGNQAVGQGMATTSLTLTEPATSAELITTFSDSSSYSKVDSLFASWGYGLAMTGNGSWTTAKELRIRLGVNVGGVAIYSHTFNWTNDFSAAWVLKGSSPSAIHGATGDIIGMAIELSWPNGWPASSSAGDTVTASSLLLG